MGALNSALLVVALPLGFLEGFVDEAHGGSIGQVGQVANSAPHVPNSLSSSDSWMKAASIDLSQRLFTTPGMPLL